MINISLNIVESDSQISNSILRAIVEQLQPVFNKTLSSIQSKLSTYVRTAIMAEPEYTSLIAGQLRSELGVPDAESKIDNLIQAWATNANIISKPISVKGNRLTGGFSIDIIKSDFSDILSLPSSVVTDSVSGSNIPWLQWLLIEGNKILIRDYKVQFGNNPRSRTGNAIMVASAKENWRVPAQFAGTVNNNWITRAIDRLDDSIINDLEKILENNL